MTVRSRRGAAIAVIAALFVFAVAWMLLPRGGDGRVDEGSSEAGSAPRAPERGRDEIVTRAMPGLRSGTQADPAQGSGPRENAERAAALDDARKRLERAEFTLREYRKATQYPPESRPASEHPDGMEIAGPERRIPLDDRADEESALFVVLKQDRVFLSGDEVVTLAVRCEDRRGQPQRCEVPPGEAREAEHIAGMVGLDAVPVPFEQSAEGWRVARFQPSTMGFLGRSATLRIAISPRAGGASRPLFFDVLYTGAAPAEFTRGVRDAAEGSLYFELPLTVRKPGRYVITGRVDDATGKPVTWTQFNDELGAGAQTARLQVHGKLIHDLQPRFPLTLRDVEGFLLLEEGDPDRELMKAWPGVVHTSKLYPVSRFSADEWSSEQRSRYLEELEKDVGRAREEVDGLQRP